MKLIIVESPAKCKKIESFLGKGYKCVASKGHIRDLEKGKDAINIDDDFKPKYRVIPSKSRVVSELKRLADTAEEIIIASDLDREGEAIGYHIMRVLGLDINTTKRIVFNQITKKAIVNSLKEPRKLDVNLFNAQQARRILDRLVGFSISPLLWKHIQGKLSAGRCQSVALKLVFDRYNKINNFDSDKYFKITGDFEIPDTDKEINLSLDTNKSKESLNDEDKVAEFLELCKETTFTLDGIKKKKSNRNPPKPFITSTLQQSASTSLGMPPDLCMKVAQKLYEKGAITYMRTDCVELSDEAMMAVKDVVIERYGEKYYQFRKGKAKKVANAQEAHEAIRPVYVNKTMDEYSGLEPYEYKLLDLIRKRTLASQMAAQVYQVYTINLLMSNSELIFTTKLEKELFQGWAILYKNPELENNALTEYMIKILKKGMILKYKQILAEQKFTKPTPRYTEASLIKELEKRGIGRPSTFSALISKIQERGYVEKTTKKGEDKKGTIFKLESDVILAKEIELPSEVEKNKLFITHTGIIVNEFLQEHFSKIFNYNFTSNVEDELDKVAKGEIIWNDLVKKVYDVFNPNVIMLSNKETPSHRQKYKRLLGVDPETDESIFVLYGKHGPVVRRGGDGEEMVRCEFAALVKGLDMETITLNQALKLLQFPKDLGKYKNNDVTIRSGRFGHYITCNSKNYAIAKDINPFSMDLEGAIKVIEAKNKNIIKEFKQFQIRNGPYGPYILKDRKFISIPKDKDPSKLTHKECLEIIKNHKPKPKFRKYNKKSNKKTKK